MISIDFDLEKKFDKVTFRRQTGNIVEISFKVTEEVKPKLTTLYQTGAKLSTFASLSPSPFLFISLALILLERHSKLRIVLVVLTLC